MESKKIKLLFITEASMTGAPVLLLDVIKVIKTYPEFDIKVLVKRYDKLAPEFKKIAKTYTIKGKLYQQKEANLFLKSIRFIQSMFNRALIYPKLISSKIIISNTTTNGNILHELKFIGARTICYVHELKNAMESWSPQSDIKYSMKYSDLFIVPSEYIKQNLIANYNISETKIRLFQTYVPRLDFKDLQNEKKMAKAKFSDQYKFSNDLFLVVGMGTADKRKGIDLFIETAHLVSKHNRNIRFIWIGGFADDKIKDAILTKMSDYNLENTVVFTGAIQRSLSNLLPFDIFFLSSREDPYPLVVLEAAALHIPSICFNGSGGIIDFVKDECGWIINDESVSDAADKIIELSLNEDKLHFSGERAYKKFIENHNNPEKVKKEFIEFIQIMQNLNGKSVK